MNDLLIVYNTFGQGNNFRHYANCIKSILDSDISSNYKIVISSCRNSDETRQNLINYFGDKISYVFINKGLTVNITFNKTVREMVKLHGEFTNYLYVDSGVDFLENKQAIQSALNLMKCNEYAMLSFQVENDNALTNVGIKDFPLKGRNHIVPLGSACNGHAEIFSNEIFKAYNRKLIPDVFSAYCTESVYSFLCAGVMKKWVILGDYVLRHAKGVDGASSSSPHTSPRFHNTWNNLMCGRDAQIFINDPEAIECGLGYEECNNIMLHNKNSYFKDYVPKNPEKLKEIINKYLFLSDLELNYDTI